jgi:hypothetical protein
MCHLTPTVRSLQQAIPNGCPAKALEPSQRLKIGLQALAGSQPITTLADRFDVSRKFVYQQSHKAEEALNKAFSPDPWANADDQLLFYLPVTKAWLKQLVLALILICHSSFRGVVELLRDLFDWRLSVGTFYHIVQAAIKQASPYNAQQHLANVRVGAHDEIYQAGQPVLVGVDAHSTYCYLLSLEDNLDADTWGVRLLELADRGFAPDATVADGGRCLRAGQQLALPKAPCRGDVFHALREVQHVVTFLENRAYDALAMVERLERKHAAARCRGKSNLSLGQKLRQARASMKKAIPLSDDMSTLYGWLRHDILSLAGPCHADRLELYDFVVAELRRLAPQCPHRLEDICRYLENFRDPLLAFAEQLDQELDQLAEQFQVPVARLRELLLVLDMPHQSSRRWTKDAVLRQQLRDRYHPLQVALSQIMRNTIRASSVVENLNSRLRNYFFLRRQLGPDYLNLLQFFLNHRRFQRSEHPERVGKSPAELLTRQAHPHWLEMLGYTPFRRN